jgi:hypothetical protein
MQKPGFVVFVNSGDSHCCRKGPGGRRSDGRGRTGLGRNGHGGHTGHGCYGLGRPGLPYNC